MSAQYQDRNYSGANDGQMDDFLSLIEHQMASTSSATANLDMNTLDQQQQQPRTASHSTNVPETPAAWRDASGADQQHDDDESESEDENAGDHKRKKGKGGQQPAAGKAKADKSSKADTEEADPKRARRKSTGESATATTGKDEGKVSKRKEQNRAAQRAFRERKERHVKDLEDKVAALIAATEGQKSENENLRELLVRLQQENVQLKQSAFTFTFPHGQPAPTNATKPPSPPGSVQEKDQDSPQSLISISSESPQAMTGRHNSRSASDSPFDLYSSSESSTPPAGPTFSSSTFNAFAATQPQEQLFAMPAASRGSSSDSYASRQGSASQQSQQAGTSAKPASTNTIQQPQKQTEKQPQSSTTDSVVSPGNFAFSPSAFSPSAFSPSAYFPPAAESPASPSFQLLASNPLFTSYRDPTLDEQMSFFSSQIHGTPSAGVLPSTSSATAGDGLPDPFGGQFDDFFQYGMIPPSFLPPVLDSTGPAFNTVSPGVRMQDAVASTTSPSMDGSTRSASIGGEPSPAGSLPRFDSSSSTGSESPAPIPTSCSEGSKNGVDCTQAQIREKIRTQVPSTFGQPLPDLNTELASSSSASPETTLSGPASTIASLSGLPDWDKTFYSEDDLFGNTIHVSADPKAKNTPLHEVWQRVRESPGFRYEDFDLESLCTEFKGKAKCNGSEPVLDEHQVKQLLEEIPYRRKLVGAAVDSSGVEILTEQDVGKFLEEQCRENMKSSKPDFGAMGSMFGF